MVNRGYEFRDNNLVTCGNSGTDTNVRTSDTVGSTSHIPLLCGVLAQLAPNKTLLKCGLFFVFWQVLFSYFFSILPTLPNKEIVITFQKNKYSCKDKFKHLLSRNHSFCQEIKLRRYMIQTLVLLGLTLLFHKKRLDFF